MRGHSPLSPGGSNMRFRPGGIKIAHKKEAALDKGRLPIPGRVLSKPFGLVFHPRADVQEVDIIEGETG